jgi:hypothetical protein
MSERYTSQITKEWMRARQHVESAQERLDGANTALQELSNELGKVLAPSDMTIKEVIGVWHRIDNHDERCFQVTKLGSGDYKIILRGDARKRDEK